MLVCDKLAYRDVAEPQGFRLVDHALPKQKVARRIIDLQHLPQKFVCMKIDIAESDIPLELVSQHLHRVHDPLTVVQVLLFTESLNHCDKPLRLRGLAAEEDIVVHLFCYVYRLMLIWEVIVVVPGGLGRPLLYDLVDGFEPWIVVEG